MKQNPLKEYIFLIPFTLLACVACNNSQSKTVNGFNEQKIPAEKIEEKQDSIPEKITFDSSLYDLGMKELANNDLTGKWPVKGPYPLPGAVFPYKRVIAFYGNLFSKRMGILGELPKDVMLKKLQGEVAKWQAADTSVPVIPALHYIAVTAQGSPGRDNKYRLRMPFHQIDTIINWAKEINALVFVDIQVGHSTVNAEVPALENYLKMPDVHLGIDPEFSLKGGEKPGSKIGSFSADDINFVINYLSGIVKKNNLPPKVLVIHRFTQGMITDYVRIKKTPEVQVVIDMDGWGNKMLKKGTWLRYIYNEPVQFAGFKIFYKNDLKKNPTGLYSPEELLKFTPKPVYIQYQ